MTMVNRILGDSSIHGLAFYLGCGNASTSVHLAALQPAVASLTAGRHALRKTTRETQVWHQEFILVRDKPGLLLLESTPAKSSCRGHSPPHTEVQLIGLLEPFLALAPIFTWTTRVFGLAVFLGNDGLLLLREAAVVQASQLTLNPQPLCGIATFANQARCA